MLKILAAMMLWIAYAFVIVYDFAESPETLVSNIWLSITQFVVFVDEKNKTLTLRPSNRPE